MSLLVLFYFLATFLLHSLQTNNLVNILELRNNLFHTVNENVHNIINRMFAVLKLNSNFLKSTKIRLLLTMHSDLNNIAVKNFDVYKEIINISKTENYTYFHTDLEITEILNQIVKEFRKEKEVKHPEGIKKDNITNASSSIESLDFLEDFLRKVNALTVDNFTMRYSNKALDNEKNGFELEKSEKQNLKLWSPPTNHKIEDLFNNLTNRRIYKGKRTRIKKYPFVASVHVMKEFMCAGSIISKDFVITAASCLQIVYNNKRLKENPTSIFIRIGSDYTKRFGEIIPIRKLHFHPQYEPFSLNNNLVLLRMGKQLKFLKKKRKIRRIHYDKTAMRLQDMDEVTILGWGATDNVPGVKTYQPLLVADIEVYNFEKCQEIYSKAYVSDRNFCVGFASKGSGACNKDVGGPGVVDGVLVGVISFGPPVCGAADMPTVLVKLGFYAAWIESVMKQESTTRFTKPKTPIQLNTEVFTTISTKESDEAYPQNPNYARTGIKQDHPEEVVILNQILNDVILSNKSIIDNLLYGALEDDFNDIFKPSTKAKLHHHPLVNKSLFLPPDVHDFRKEHQPNVTMEMTKSSPGLTTAHPDLSIHYIDDDGERIRYMEAAYHLMTMLTPPTTRTSSTTEEPRHITDTFGRSRNITLLKQDDTESEYSKVVSSADSEKVSDIYEDASKENDESGGISIDVEVMRQREETTTKLNSELNVERLKREEFSIDSNINKHKPKNIKSYTKRVLRKPYTSNRMHKVTRLIANSKINVDEYENYRSRTRKRKSKKRHRYQ